MAQQTYHTRGIVLRKTKLGESDLIVTMLREDGSQIRAVAKGARKPSGSFAARLELYSVVDALVVCGKNLDIIKEVRLERSNSGVRGDLEHSACAAPMVDLLDRITQTGLENSRLFPLTCTALCSLEHVSATKAPAVTAAHLLKVFAFVGIRPHFDSCVNCGCPPDKNFSSDRVFLSYRDGGILCPACARQTDLITVPWYLINWSKAFLQMTFAQIEETDIPPEVMFDVLKFCQAWTQEHIGVRLKSLNFLFTCGLF